MPVIADLAVRDESGQISLFGSILLRSHLRSPLERAESLRYEERRTDSDRYVAGALVKVCLAPDVDDLVTQMRDSENVLIRLSRQSEHEIQFDPVPAAGEGETASAQNVFFGNAFVDNVAKPLGAGLCGESNACLLAFGQFLHQVEGERVDTQRRQGDGYVRVFLMEFRHQFAEPGIIIRAERCEGYFIIARILQNLFTGPENHIFCPVTDGLIDLPCLAETASVDASAEDLHHSAVKNGLQIRHDRTYGIERCIQVICDILADLNRRIRPVRLKGTDRRRILGSHGRMIFIFYVIERRHVDRSQIEDFSEKVPAVPSCFLMSLITAENLFITDLALSNIEEIDKRRHRLRVGRCRSAGDDKRVIVCAVF